MLLQLVVSLRRISHSPLGQVFKSDVSPDGNARDELDVACAVDHPNLTKAIGIVRASTDGGSGSSGATRAATNDRSSKLWLVMERVEGKPLAEKPDFTSVLRCRWGAGRRFEPVLVLAVLLQVTVLIYSSVFLLLWGTWRKEERQIG